MKTTAEDNLDHSKIKNEKKGQANQKLVVISIFAVVLLGALIVLYFFTDTFVGRAFQTGIRNSAGLDFSGGIENLPLNDEGTYPLKANVDQAVRINAINFVMKYDSAKLSVNNCQQRVQQTLDSYFNYNLINDLSLIREVSCDPAGKITVNYVFACDPTNNCNNLPAPAASGDIFLAIFLFTGIAAGTEDVYFESLDIYDVNSLPGTTAVSLNSPTRTSPDRITVRQTTETVDQSLACTSSNDCSTGQTCSGGICISPRCGNGVLEVIEQWDDGNTAGDDGCSSTCQIYEAGWLCNTPGQLCQKLCGNGVVEVAASEWCDDGNNANGDGCTRTCQIENGYVCPRRGGVCILSTQACGDGVVQVGEYCDDGNAASSDGCAACQIENGYTCSGSPSACVRMGETTYINFCGDGIIQDNGGNGIAGDIDDEQCDDGNRNDNDACTNICRTAFCGDGVVRAGTEQCDDGNMVNTDGCTTQCRTNVCGDGIVWIRTEYCDDGNLVNDDGCSSTCQIELIGRCGDGTVNPNEQCDDGNQNDNDACTNICRTAFCGDGVVRAGTEQCDDSNPANYDDCTNECRIAVCGDGITRAGTEQCDDRNTITEICAYGQRSCTVCNNQCQSVAGAATYCGDGIIQTGEQCDDGNAVLGDGCSATCSVESSGAGLLDDVNGDEVVDLTDAIDVARFDLGISTSLTFNAARGDVTCNNGAVDIADAILIARVDLGIPGFN